jgi:hypothetical protein
MSILMVLPVEERRKRALSANLIASTEQMRFQPGEVGKMKTKARE